MSGSGNNHLIRRTLAAATIGNVLEFYDFLLFGMLMPIFSPVFFPDHDPTIALLKAYALFAVGFVTRPLGGIVFGHIGDRYGRKAALTLSIFCMAAPTMVIGLLPGYAEIGVFAPIILLCCRLIQGVCAGGEYNGSGLMVMEHVAPRVRYVYTAIVAASASFGGLLAALVSLGFILLPFPDWGWRLPFLLGGVVAMIGVYLRRHSKESPEFLANRVRVPMMDIFRHHRRACLVTIGIAGFSVGPFYMTTVYVPSYLMSTLAFTKTSIVAGNCLILLVTTLLGVLCGPLSLRFSVRRMMYLGALFVALLAIPFFHYVNSPDIRQVIGAQLLMMGVSELYSVFGLGLVLQLFPTSVRYRGSAFCYNVGVAMFCGTIPMICSRLIHYYHSPYVPAMYLIFTSIMGAVAVHYSKPLA